MNLPAPPAKSNRDTGENAEVPVVRAYMMTGGRISIPDDITLAFETMVSLTDKGHDEISHLMFERLKIAQLAAEESLSVAELASKLNVPLGVAQVLCADMLRAGLLEQHASSQNLSEDVNLLTRLINGVRAL